MYRTQVARTSPAFHFLGPEGREVQPPSAGIPVQSECDGFDIGGGGVPRNNMVPYMAVIRKRVGSK